MLQTAVVYVREIIERTVIMIEADNVSEVKSGKTRFLKNGKVCSVRQQLVDSWASEFAAGRGAALANSLMSQPFLSLVSNIIAGPLLPRASKLRTTPKSLAQGCWYTKALAPRLPISSPSEEEGDHIITQ